MGIPNPHKSNTPKPGLAEDFERVLSNLETARSFGKGVHQSRVLALGLKLLDSDAGLEFLYRAAPRFDAAGVFLGSDWASPEILQPGLVRGTLLGGGLNPALECLSELRTLAIALGDAEEREDFDRERARLFLEDVLAQNLDLLFPPATEATREQSGQMAERIRRLFRFLLDRLGPGGILGALVIEAERVLLQRPIMIQRVERLLHSARQALPRVGEDDEVVAEARHLIAALHAPTELARERSAHEYAELLPTLEPEVLDEEARIFGETMVDTGLVSPQHAALLKFLAEQAPELLPDALALDNVGQVSLQEHGELIVDVIRFAIRPETARSIYGLSRLLDQGTLFFPPVPPGLRRLMVLPIDPDVAAQLRDASEWPDPPPAEVLLLAGTLSVLGQPRGVDQGHNPTCQAARAISLWAQNDTGYLLELIALAARDDELVMHFEGDAIHSDELSFGLAAELHTELDPVSLVLTPHLDRIYMEMSRRTIGREGDGHRWVNPEFHGWWVQRGFAELLDDEAVRDCDGFVRLFHAAYHPDYNGGRRLVYAQPCGVASTDHGGNFVGWHAIAIQRVARDPDGVWRVYFFNPNRDKGQNWGQEVVTSTHDHGEFEGESSLPFEQFASRLYVYHYKERELGDPDAVPAETVAEVREAIAASWAAGLEWLDDE